jgi:hypothetical protein
VEPFEFELENPNTMKLVPDWLDRYINKAIDEAIAKLPESQRVEAEAERKQIRTTLLAYFDEYGRIPAFTLEGNIVLAFRDSLLAHRITAPSMPLNASVASGNVPSATV